MPELSIIFPISAVLVGALDVYSIGLAGCANITHLCCAWWIGYLTVTCDSLPVSSEARQGQMIN